MIDCAPRTRAPRARPLHLFAASLLMTTLASPAHADPGPPPTDREPVEEALHGQTVADPYRWLEGDEEGKPTPRVDAWTDAQNAHTRAVLDALPGRAALEARVGELMRLPWIGLPEVRQGRLFFQERTGEQDQPVLYLADGPDGAPRPLLDPNALDAQGLVSLDFVAPNPTGELLAFGLSRKGDEKTVLHLLDVDSGRWLADTIPNKAGGVSWLPDGRSFVYSALRDPDDAYSREVRLHWVGEHPRQDPVLFAQHSTTWGPFGYASPDGRWLILGYWTGTRSNDLWAVDLDRWRETGELEKRDLFVGQDGKASGPVFGDTIYVETTVGAPRGQVVAIDLNDPTRRRVVVPEPKDAAITDVALARGVLVVTLLRDASTAIERYRLDGTPLGPIALPGIGTAWLSTEHDRRDAWLGYASFDRPTELHRVDLETGALTPWRKLDVPVDPSLLTVRRAHFRSKDGTQVGMFLVHRKDLKPDGDRPTLLYGYGGFGISQTPYFSATLFPWLEAGGVYAVANLRGGGEGGDAWHAAGTLERKQAVFDDFVAAAEWLVAEKLTRPERLAIAGGSNGGLLTGAALVQRPELFRAVISSVPLLDMLRYHRFLMARFWVPEYGSADEAAQFPFLRAYSPYHNVREGVRYPAVFLTAGEHDTRVHPLHARKMAALLQAATASPPAERPVLLWVDRDAGHGAGKPLALRIRDVVDQRIFLMWQLGMLEGAPPAPPAPTPTPPAPKQPGR